MLYFCISFVYVEIFLYVTFFAPFIESYQFRKVPV